MADKLLQETTQALSELPSGYGEGKRLFEVLDKHQQEENMSPWLANSLRNFMVAVEKNTPGKLEELAIRGRGGLRFALTQLEEEFLPTLRALEAVGGTDGKKADEIFLEYTQWMKSEEEV